MGRRTSTCVIIRSFDQAEDAVGGVAEAVMRLVIEFVPRERVPELVIGVEDLRDPLP